MMWEIKDRGFLPEKDPLELTQRDSKDGWIPQDSFFASMDAFMASVPAMVEERRFREEVVHFLRSGGFPLVLNSDWSVEFKEKLFKHYCYLASSYVHALHETTATRLPMEIAEPLRELSRMLDRKPILSYGSYCLNNWRRVDPKQPITLENIELQQNFSKSNKVDEDWFILVHVDIEARAADGIKAIKEYRDQYYRNSPPHVVEGCDPHKYEGWLKAMHASLRMMNITMARMPENCSEDFYFKAVRPFIFGFDKVLYEARERAEEPILRHSERMTLRGETGAQSSIVPAYVAALEVEHKDSMLTTHLKDMRHYMPKEHRDFLSDLESVVPSGQIGSIRTLAEREPKRCGEPYNACLEELLKFRTKHLEFAINYIQKKVDDPTGTGGTPFIPWLTQLRDETETRYIKNETNT